MRIESYAQLGDADSRSTNVVYNDHIHGCNARQDALSTKYIPTPDGIQRKGSMKNLRNVVRILADKNFDSAHHPVYCVRELLFPRRSATSKEEHGTETEKWRDLNVVPNKGRWNDGVRRLL